MMDGRSLFEKAAERFFNEHPCEDAASARRALLLLYDLVVETAEKALAAQERSREWNEGFYLVQQVLCFTPLRLFLRELTADPLLPIRAGAKGELCDRTGMQEFWNDPEVGVISSANLAVMFNPPDGCADPRLKEAMNLWYVSTQGVNFTPQLVIRTLDDPPQ